MASTPNEISAILEEKLQKAAHDFKEMLGAAGETKRKYLASFEDITDDVVDVFDTKNRLLTSFMSEEAAIKYQDLLIFLFSAFKTVGYRVPAETSTTKPHLLPGSSSKEEDQSDNTFGLDVLTPLRIPSGKVTTIDQVFDTLTNIGDDNYGQTEDEIRSLAQCFVDVLNAESLI